MLASGFEVEADRRDRRHDFAPASPPLSRFLLYLILLLSPTSDDALSPLEVSELEGFLSSSSSTRVQLASPLLSCEALRSLSLTALRLSNACGLDFLDEQLSPHAAEATPNPSAPQGDELSSHSAERVARLLCRVAAPPAARLAPFVRAAPRPPGEAPPPPVDAFAAITFACLGADEALACLKVPPPPSSSLSP
ncbi:hypothetical protein AB1Y20_017174 [Prymnesium parvum]